MGWQDRDYAGPGERGRFAGRVAGPRTTLDGWRGVLSGPTGVMMMLVAVGFVSCIALPVLVTYGVMQAESVFPGGQVWRLLSHPLVSIGRGGSALLDMILSLFAWWAVGRLAEQLLTTGRWMLVVAGGVVTSGLLMELAWKCAPNHFADHVIAGSLTSIYSLMGACVARVPRMSVGLFFVPMGIELRWIVAVIAAISLIFAMRGSSGHTANLMALAAGAAIARLGTRLPDPFPAIRIKIHDWKYHRQAQSLNDHHAEVDRILAKIKREGMGNLTAAEKKTLKRDTARLRG